MNTLPLAMANDWTLDKKDFPFNDFMMIFSRAAKLNTCNGDQNFAFHS